MRNDSEWTFGVRDLEKGELWSGYVKNVVDGDTIDVSFNIYGVQRIRLVGINAPDIDEEGYEEAKEFLNEMCMWEEVKLDVDECIVSQRLSPPENFIKTQSHHIYKL